MLIPLCIGVGVGVQRWIAKSILIDDALDSIRVGNASNEDLDSRLAGA
jgi:hypothetical protein